MEDNILIRLKPYHAMQILWFLKEFEPHLKKINKCNALSISINQFKQEIANKITLEQIKDVERESEINIALGYEPKD